MNQSPKEIVILGGSYGGLSVGHYLLRHVIPKLPKKNEFRVTLVSASDKVICRPACPRALVSDEMFPQEKLFVAIDELFQQYPKDVFRFINGTASKLDHTGRTVSVETTGGVTETLSFYSLVVATGASTASPLFGLNKDADHLRSSWATFRQALSMAKSIVISGGGPAGVETAGELGDFLNGRPVWFGARSDRPKIPITIITADSKLLPSLRPSLAGKAEKYLAELGVEVLKNSRVVEVSPQGAGTIDVGSNAVLSLADGRKIEADLYIPATGLRPNTGFIDSTLLTADGHVNTDPLTLRVVSAEPRIYAIGDVASYARPAIHLILDAVPVLCSNIRHDLLPSVVGDGGQPSADKIFKVDGTETQLVPIGRSKGVGAMKGYQLPSFVVWLIKGRDYWLWTTPGLWSGKQWGKAA